jgi:hypothetical protein
VSPVQAGGLNKRIENFLEEIISGRSILLRPFFVLPISGEYTIRLAFCRCRFFTHGIFLVVKKIILPEKGCYERDFLKY